MSEETHTHANTLPVTQGRHQGHQNVPASPHGTPLLQAPATVASLSSSTRLTCLDRTKSQRVG